MKMESREAWIAERVESLTNRTLSGGPVVFDDTSNYMSIDRDHVIELDGDFFLIRCNEREGRFGLDDQPKFWVKRALSLRTGQTHILKLVFHEEFKVRIGPLDIKCTRSAEKEGRVLEMVAGDKRFMNGHTAVDSAGNLVRIIDFIHGKDLLNHLDSLEITHEEYFNKSFPEFYSKTMSCFRAIQFLHDSGSCHGDIRNDHIFVERKTGDWRWIDFDLTQEFSDFDVWSLGNILHCVVGKGFVKFRDVLQERPELSEKLTEEDASAFVPHRIMNLGVVFPYLPKKLNDVLLRYSVGASASYDSVAQLLDDMGDCASSMGWPIDGISL
jgi:hypothetical protein